MTLLIVAAAILPGASGSIFAQGGSSGERKSVKAQTGVGNTDGEFSPRAAAQLLRD